jgi:hypothetical protein
MASLLPRGARGVFRRSPRRRAQIGFPVVLKTTRAGVLHKTEAGGVIVGLRNPEDLQEACRSVAARTSSASFLVQEQIGQGPSFCWADAEMKPSDLLLVGTGGFLAEAIRDVSLALGPVSLETARSLVPLGLRSRLMGGYRGLPSWEVEPAARALVAIDRVLADHPRIREIDVNPLIVRGVDAIAVDALVVVD